MELSDLERQGRQAMSRHHYGDGRWGLSEEEMKNLRHEIQTRSGWTITKRWARKPQWATCTGHKKATKVHAVKYVLKGVHRTGLTIQLTVWRCGQSTYSTTKRVSSPMAVCTNCLSAFKHKGTTLLTEDELDTLRQQS